MNNLKKFFLVGPMGAGKSTIGRLLARELKLDFYDTDDVIVERAGVDINWIFDKEGESGFRDREQRVIDEFTQKPHIVLATGGGAILDANNRIALAGRGTVIYLKTSIEQQMERVKNDSKRPLLQVDNLEEKLQQLRLQRENYYQEVSDYMFNTDGCSAKTVVHAIIKELFEGS
ncbi:MAG: shikimate kinase AroK [Proteobacteria bacterium]|nr:shikimate kinase AroK [Pseudomonadota bacterium]